MFFSLIDKWIYTAIYYRVSLTSNIHQPTNWCRGARLTLFLIFFMSTTDMDCNAFGLVLTPCRISFAGLAVISYWAFLFTELLTFCRVNNSSLQSWLWCVSCFLENTMFEVQTVAIHYFWCITPRPWCLFTWF